MTYLIISIYEGGYDFTINVNGKNYSKIESQYPPYYNKEHLDFFKPYLEILESNNYEDEFAKLDFDFIVLCEDGGVMILKGGK